MNRIKPLSPDDAGTAYLDYLPDEIIYCINSTIVKNLDGNVADFTADQVIEEILNYTSLQRAEIFDKNYLNFETIYENVGWKVAVDRPGFCETYSTRYTFTRRGNGTRRKGY